jgi:hypothetical protein
MKMKMKMKMTTNMIVPKKLGLQQKQGTTMHSEAVQCVQCNLH